MEAAQKKMIADLAKQRDELMKMVSFATKNAPPETRERVLGKNAYKYAGVAAKPDVSLFKKQNRFFFLKILIYQKMDLSFFFIFFSFFSFIF